MQKVVLASGNRGKLKEMQEVLHGTGLELLLQTDFNIIDAEETGKSFIENAILKARHASAATGLPALADDSGLCVDALDGAPGIYSARYSGNGATDAKNNAKLLAELSATDNRSASFVCVLALVQHADDPLPLICEGRWRGAQGWTLRQWAAISPRVGVQTCSWPCTYSMNRLSAPMRPGRPTSRQCRPTLIILGAPASPSA